MKKKRFASLLIAAPLAFLAACSSTPSLVLEANWFSNTSTKTIPDDFEETLVYAVSFEKSNASLNGQYSLDYPDGGTYTVKFEDGETDGKKTYVFTTELRIQSVFTLNGTSTERLDNVVTTRVEFLDAQHELKPLSSEREMHEYMPVGNPMSTPASLEASYVKYDFKTEIVYDDENEKATLVKTNLAAEKPEESKTTNEIGLGVKGFYFDNDQLMPLLRAAELSSSMPIFAIDFTTNSMEALSVKDGPTAVTQKQSVKFKADEAAVERDFNAMEISIGYGKANSGGSHKYTIANRTHRDSNAYRNVILQYSYPVGYSHGTLTFRLTSADFYG